MVKGEKRSRIKRLIKQKESLLKRANEHKIKAKIEKGRKDTTPKYWEGEAERFEEQAECIDKVLERLGKKKEDFEK